MHMDISYEEAIEFVKPLTEKIDLTMEEAQKCLSVRSEATLRCVAPSDPRRASRTS